MVHMKVKNGDDVVELAAQDAVRIGHERVRDMAQDLLNSINRDAYQILKRLQNDEMEQLHSSTGDVMVKAIVSKFGPTELYVELYVCKIERYAGFSL